MSVDVTFDVIREVLAQNARLPVDVASLEPDDDLYQSGMSSHAAVNVMIALEEAFDVEFPQEILHKDTFRTMSSIKGVVERLGEDLPTVRSAHSDPAA